MTTSRNRHLVSLEDGAAYAKVSTRTMRRWIGGGLLNGYRAGPKLLRVDLDEIDHMMRLVPTADRRRRPQPSARRTRPPAKAVAKRRTQMPQVKIDTSRAAVLARRVMAPGYLFDTEGGA